MGYILYDRQDTRIVSKTYKTHSAAQAELTRRRKAAAGEWGVLTADQDPLFLLGIAEVDYYHKFIERKVLKVNMMTGKEYVESVNTPLACSPASETYWSM